MYTLQNGTSLSQYTCSTDAILGYLYLVFMGCFHPVLVLFFMWLLSYLPKLKCGYFDSVFDATSSSLP